MFYSETQSFLNFLRILNRFEVGVFARAVKLDSPGTVPTSSRAEKSYIQNFLRSQIYICRILLLNKIILLLNKNCQDNVTLVVFDIIHLTLAVFAKTLCLCTAVLS
jgi:hypothetical protein